MHITEDNKNTENKIPSMRKRQNVKDLPTLPGDSSVMQEVVILLTLPLTL